MKILPSIIAATLLASSFGSFANDRTERETVFTKVTSSKAMAYKVGVAKLASIEASTSYTLSQEFGSAHTESNSFHVEDGFVTVQERADVNGNINYVGIVNIDLSYSYKDNDD